MGWPVGSNCTIRTLAIDLVIFLLVGCAPAVPRENASPESRPAAPSRPLVIAIRSEPESIATRRIGQPGSGFTGPKKMFNAGVALINESSTPHPYIVERLPALHSDSWRVFPDGRMETTYRLRDGLRWHDGTPATPEDFRFVWHVFTAPGLGYASAPPFHAIDEVIALDPRTVLIRWKAPYPEAGVLSATNDEFPLLPAHVLGEAFEQLDTESFVNLPFWTRDYVGLGPYRVDRWEPGSFIEGAAFDGHILGRPKIERIKIVFIADGNTTLANLLAGEVHLASDNSIGLPQMEVLRRDGSGLTLLPAPGGGWRVTYFQLRPELATPRALIDHRVRKAFAHGFDKETLNEGVFYGAYVPVDTMILPNARFGPAAERGATKYPFDPRRSELLRNEAGFFRGPDGTYSSATEGRLSVSLKVTAGPADVEAQSVMASTWRQLGFDIEESVIPAAQAQVSELGATFPGMLTRTTFEGLTTLVAFNTAGIPRPENRWTGPNRGGWSNLEYDRLADAFKTTLDEQMRADLVTQMMRVFTDELPVIPMFVLNRPIPYPTGLRGPKSVPGETNFAFNIHEWEFR